MIVCSIKPRSTGVPTDSSPVCVQCMNSTVFTFFAPEPYLSAIMAGESQNNSEEIRVTIHLPKCIGVDIDFVKSVHSRQDTISELKDALASTSQINQITNYDLVYDGAKITEKFDHLTELGNVFAEGALEVKILMIERAYNLRAVYEHVNRFREKIGLNFYDYASKSFGVGVGYSSLNSLGLKLIDAESKVKMEEATTEASKEPEDQVFMSEEDSLELKKKTQAVLDVVDDSVADSVLEKWVLPLKSLTLSQWNPVPQQQKLKGDLLYLTLTTLESETFAITSHATGFFVSRMTGTNFNPVLKVNEKGVSHKSYTLFKLISNLSPKFIATLSSNRSALFEASQFPETYLVPSQVVTRFPWAVTEEQQLNQIVPDYSRIQTPVFVNCSDGADLSKDWNDEFQSIKEFSRETFQERLLRDKLLNKCIQEFNLTATTTALDIIRGNLTPLNPNEEYKKHVFLRNNILYYFGVNATGYYDLTGGDEAARYCFGKDVNSIKIINRVDAGGACTLLSCVVDFMGERVICQAPIPGVFSEQFGPDGESIDKVSYGYFLENDEIKIDSIMEKSLKPMAEVFHLKPHSLKLPSGAATPVYSKLIVSKDTKGIKGTDGRNYIIDLHRTTPIDINFLDSYYDISADLSYPHKEASIRHEAVEEWYKRKTNDLFKKKIERLQKEGTSDKSDSDDKPPISIPYEEIIFNPDAFLGADDSEEDRYTVREISTLVTKYLIPEFLDDISKNTVPVDGTQLTSYLHKSGINMRYLGEIATQALAQIFEFQVNKEKKIAANENIIADFKKKQEAESEDGEGVKAKEEVEDEAKNRSKGGTKEEAKEYEEREKEQSTAAQLYPVVATLNTLHELAVQEMIVRGVKHVLRKLGRDVPYFLKPQFVAHFHNCLLGSGVDLEPKASIDSCLKPFLSKEETKFVDLDTEKVKALVEHEVYTRFRFPLAVNWIESLKKPQILREIALRFGIQWKSQEYYYEKSTFDDAYKTVENPQNEITLFGKKKKSAALPVEPAVRATTFIPEDIIAFVPLVKDSTYRCLLVDEVFDTARHQLLQGDKNAGLDLCSELIASYQQIYGCVHSETADGFTALSQLYADCGMFSEACILSRKAIILNERLRGVDSYETVNSYIKSSIFEGLNKNPFNSFLLNGKAFCIWALIFGRDHPNTLNTFTSCAAILESLKLGEEAQRVHKEALAISTSINGVFSEITGVIQFRFGGYFYQTGQFEKALEEFTAASKLFAKLLGPEDALTKECFAFAINIRRYLEYKKLEKETKVKKDKTTSAPKKVPAKHENGKRGKKLKSVIAANHEIASKSVDEILQFIEGKTSSKQKKIKRLGNVCK